MKRPPRRWKKARPTLVGALVFCLLVAVLPSRAAAHSLRTSSLLLDIGERSVRAEVQLPVDQLELALGRRLERAEGSITAHERELLMAYVAEHLSARSRDARDFTVRLEDVAERIVDSAATVIVHAELEAPPGLSTMEFVVHCDVIQHKVVPHRIFVSVRHDFAAGKVDGEPDLVDVAGFQHNDVVVARHGGALTRGLAATFRLGRAHIAEGTDHVLFLLTLLLVAPLASGGRRWLRPAPLRGALRHTLAVVSAFTLGHSATLAVAAFGVARIPVRPVEAAIAASIVVSAVHAVRPIFAGREPWVAGGFGLVHGLAFAGALRDLGFDHRTLGFALLGFNLGIEAEQLAIVACVMPSLILLSRQPSYVYVRDAGAAVAALAGAAWLVERTLGSEDAAPLRWLTSDVDALAHAASSHALAATICLTAVSALVWKISHAGAQTRIGASSSFSSLPRDRAQRPTATSRPNTEG